MAQAAIKKGNPVKCKLQIVLAGLADGTKFIAVKWSKHASDGQELSGEIFNSQIIRRDKHVIM